MLTRENKSQLKSRMVLDDCRAALIDLRQANSDRVLFRRRWVAVMALLRAVGHVLDKVDGDRSDLPRAVIDEQWKLTRPPIFTDFIDLIRDLTVKEYRSRVFDVGNPGHSPMSVEAPNASAMADNVIACSSEGMEPVLVFRDEPFAGQPIYDLITMGIDWWEDYLTAIERQIAERQPDSPSR